MHKYLVDFDELYKPQAVKQ